MVKIVCKIINLSLPNLACFAPWRESIPAFEYFRLPEDLRRTRKLLTIVVQRAQSKIVNFEFRIADCAYVQLWARRSAVVILSFNVWNDGNAWNDWNKRQQAGAFEGAKMAEEKLTTK
jgi:hypothetical protein